MVNQREQTTIAAELRAASKTYGKVRALDVVSLTVGQGETVALLGPNGAGKTTAISLMLGLRRPTSGSAMLFGRNPRDLASRMRTGVMLQESGVPDTLKVGEVVELLRRLYPQPLTVAAALAAGGLERQAGRSSGSTSPSQSSAIPTCSSWTSRPSGWTWLRDRSSGPTSTI